MTKLDPVVARLSAFMAIIAGATLIAVMLLTVVDVILRYFGRPITGVYDLVALGGAVVIGFSVPYAAQKKVHVFMEMIQTLQSRVVNLIFTLFARVIALGVSLLVAWNLVRLGTGFWTTGEASLTIQIAYYPVAIGLGVCFLIQTLVFFVDIQKVLSGGTDE